MYDKAPMVERILSTADRLFYQRGIRAVGVDAIASEAGISKRSLYDYFPSKDALVAAYLERRFRPHPPSDAPPETQILAVFDRLERMFESGEFRGCPFINAVTELGDTCRAAREIAARFKEERRTWFRDMLVRMGVADPEALATQLALLVDGAITVMLVREDPAVARAAREAARVLMQAAERNVAAEA
ncbi:MAG: TetR/AcrR family transcriptional regulator [Gammaproteobacteria bacterium]